MTEEIKNKDSNPIADMAMAQAITMASVATVINQQIGIESNTKMSERVEEIALAIAKAKVLKERTNNHQVENYIQIITTLMRMMDIEKKDTENEH